MTIHQILKLIHTFPKNDLILFLEGSFRKCYNQHAFYFTQNVKEMKVHTRFYKNAQTYVHSIGFPETALGKYMVWLQEKFGAKIIENTEHYIRLSEIQWANVMNYQLWKEHHIREEERMKEASELKKISEQMIGIEEQNHKIPEKYHILIDKIKAYPIECVTPIDAFNFLQKIKKLANECTPPETI